MDQSRSHFIILLCLILARLCHLQITPASDNLIGENKKMELRRELDKITQELLNLNDPEDRLYHSYVFNSGVGNREELQLERLRKDSQFDAGEGVMTWQSVRGDGMVYMLGRKLNSVSLVVTSIDLLSNRSAHFSEHLLGVRDNVSSTSIFTRWNPVTSQQEVIVVVALDSFSADILWYRVTNGKLVNVTSWARYRKASFISVFNVGAKIQLVIIDTGSPANVEVFDIIFKSDGRNLDFRLLENFHLDSACSSMTLCSVGKQLYLVFPLPDQQLLVIYRQLMIANMSHFKYYTSLTLPQMTQAITFGLAHQTYLAVNGDNAQVLRVTNSGDFVPELLVEGCVNEWLAVPVFSYRSDVVLFSRNANFTSAFVWAGNNEGFKAIPIPECDSCLEGNWSGAVSIPFRKQHSLLLPCANNTSSLITVDTSLHENNNPFLKIMTSMLNSTNHYEIMWGNMKSKLLEIEKALAYVVNRHSKNIITAKWKLGKLETPELRLSSVMEPKVEVNSSGEIPPSSVDILTLKNMVQETVREADDLVKAVEEKEKEAWGLEGFNGKVTFKGRLIVDNLTITSLNGYQVDHIFHDSFRTNKPQIIWANKVISSLQTQNVIVDKINNSTQENLKFNDNLIMIKRNVTFLSPFTIEGNVELAAGGLVNGFDMSELCQGAEHCSVFPITDIRGEDLDNTIPKDILSDSNHLWRRVIGGKNLTVLRINGVDWETLINSVIYKNRYQYVPRTITINGTISSDKAIWVGSVEDQYVPKQRESDLSSPILEVPLPKKRPVSANRKILGVLPLDPMSVIIFSELEVVGTVTSTDSNWGTPAADVVLSDTNSILINAVKSFNASVNVSNNLELQGLVAGVNVSDLLTLEGHQVFSGYTTLQGNITLGNVTLTGLWNGMNFSGPAATLSSTVPVHVEEVTAGSVRVLETLNGFSVSDLVYTNNDSITVVRQLSAQSVSVTEDITVNGKVCNHNMTDFTKTRLSLKEEQVITGKCVIDKANISSEFIVEKLNGVEVSSVVSNVEKSLSSDVIHLSGLIVEGSITTDLGMNGYNLSEISTNAVKLQSNNDIKGHLTFKDEVTFTFLECKGFFNEKPCQDGFDHMDVVYKTNGTVVVSGKKEFLNPLSIYEDIDVAEINGHNVSNILTKTTEQKITGEVFISGDLTISEESTLEGLLNNQNLSEIINRCALSGDTISCKGDAVFKGSVDVDHFKSTGKLNGIDFDDFTESLVDVRDPQPIKGFKNFTAKTSAITNLVVHKVNARTWDDFLLNAVTQNTLEDIESSVVFTEKVSVDEIFVDFDLDADSINEVDLNGWRKNAIYLNETIILKRKLHLKSAHCLGNISTVMYGNMDMSGNLVKLNNPNTLNFLRFKSVTVTGPIDIINTVNGHNLTALEENTLKVSGDQTVTSDFVLLGDVTVSGNVNSTGQVNHNYLQDVVTIDTHQTLHGFYKFECVEARENVSTSGLMSGVNMTEWRDAAVLTSSNQEVDGVWTVQGDIELRGPVNGRSKLADVDLIKLKENIKQNLLDIHQEMKSNLSSSCGETNHHLNKARSQTSELLYLDVSQEIPVPAGVSLVKHFTSGDEVYLAICDKGCTTTIYKWDKTSGLFSRLTSEMLGFSVSQLVVLHHKQLTYLITVSSEQSTGCHYSGKHLWLFKEDQIKHMSPMAFVPGAMLQGHKNILYSMDRSGVVKWALQVIDGSPSFQGARKWTVDTAGKSFVPEDAGLGLTLQDPAGIMPLESEFLFVPEMYINCTGEIHSFSVDPTQQFMAVATTEKTEVPRYSDDVKVYHKNGHLFDKLPAQQVSNLRWLPVLDQTWLVFLQNQSSLHLYHLQGVLKGFQLKLSAKIGASGLTPLSLPMESKVNLQPYLILHTSSLVKIVQTVLQGDPYLGPNISCSFDDALGTVPNTL